LVHSAPQSSGNAEPGTHWHVPPAQPSFGRAQTFPHVPQLSRSVARSGEQRGFDAGQMIPPSHWQTPATQVPKPQAMPHPPQLAGFVANEAGSVQNPLQSSWPDGQPSSASPHPEHRASATATTRIATVRTRSALMEPMIRRRAGGP
jgi:hypothetical protein